MGSSAAERCMSENSKLFPWRSSSTESKVVASSSPVNQSLKGKHKMHDQDEGIINSPTHRGVAAQDSANRKHTGINSSCEPPMSSGLDKINGIDDVTLDQSESRRIQKSLIVVGATSFMKYPNKNDVFRKYQEFKKFDVVEDYSDHLYKLSNSKMQPERNWAKKIQQEWRILEKDLPDTIYVRVYESRVDLLRAVIVGAEGTPYHDGLFFFDVYFPCKYPDVPPEVYYHSGGLRINPNLYKGGKVCLSLLNTWKGHENEKWTPGVSTMLQVLVSIQGLVLNAKPYFNEPWFTYSSGSAKGEYQSTLYNERALIYSLKTMVYTMKKPPKHFEDLVIGHFHNRAVTILTICRGYSKGVRVGCGVNGGEEKGSLGFRKNVERYMFRLIGELKDIGVDNLEKFVPEIVPQTRSLGQKIKAFFCMKG